jgi:hypothetical protein
MAKKATIGSDGYLIEDKAIALVPHTFAIAGEIKIPSGDTDYIPGFFVPVPTGQKVFLESITCKINSGTSATVKLQADGSDITGFTGISVTPTAGTTNPTDVEITSLQFITLVVTGVSGTPKNLSATLMLRYENT